MEVGARDGTIKQRKKPYASRNPREPAHPIVRTHTTCMFRALTPSFSCPARGRKGETKPMDRMPEGGTVSVTESARNLSGRRKWKNLIHTWRGAVRWSVVLLSGICLIVIKRPNLPVCLVGPYGSELENSPAKPHDRIPPSPLCLLSEKPQPRVVRTGNRELWRVNSGILP